jgi:hypothetical protein
MPAMKPIRRGQLITPFGVGAMVDFPGDESLMTAGLDAWPFATDACPADWRVIEERLQARLQVTHFRLPPEFRDPEFGVLNPNQHIPFVRFPRWHYCPRRGVMKEFSLMGGRETCSCSPGLECYDAKRKPYLMPVRIVAVCIKGHIRDFPFMEWAHREAPVGQDHTLRFLAGRSSASLAGIKIQCSCGRAETLAGAFDFDQEEGGRLHRMGIDCTGSRPWVADSGSATAACGEYLRVVQRGATNVYFPEVRTSIYLPLWAEDSRRDVVRALENPRLWDSLAGGLQRGDEVPLERCDVIARLYGFEVQEFKAAAQRRLDGADADASVGQDGTEEEYRRQEYEALRSGRGGAGTDLLVDIRPASSYGPQVAAICEGIGLVRKLRETRALAGFTRLLPPDGPSDSRLQSLKLRNDIDWLPATIVRGEGIFLELKLEVVRRWFEQRSVSQRVTSLVAAYNRRRVERGQAPRNVTAKFLMMHTLAHVLITQLSFDCGYGSSSLRERIYCDFDDEPRPMQGILLYTASGDADGTMGGLVRQGDPDRFEQTLLAAVRRAQWCSSDPVCIESTGQGVDNANLAACHGCVLLPETSCEEGNRLLDRGVIVGTPADRRTGLF